MDIKTKFNLGDIVYLVTNDQMFELAVCPVCEGKGVAISTDPDGSAGKESKCSNCHGSGRYVAYTHGYHCDEARITEVYVGATARGHFEIKYELEHWNRHKTEAEERFIFSTEEEGQEKCNYLNQKAAEEKARRKTRREQQNANRRKRKTETVNH